MPCKQKIALRPPMGWNSWDCYGAAVNEQQVRQNAEYMAKYLKEYGWEYVVVDIQWYQPSASSHAYEPFAPLCMDAYGRLMPAENRFPSAKGGVGFKPLADYIHSLGLKFGIHIMRGLPRMAAHNHLPILNCDKGCADVANPNSICAWNPDMYGLKTDLPEARAYYDSIFQLYASWGVDYVKCDDIAREYPHCAREIEVISAACRNCGRDIVLSLSPGAAPLEQARHLQKYANMWRITDDFWDEWKLLYAMFERAEKWCIHSGPGHWPDADMLPIGALRQCYSPENWTNFTNDELYTMMTLWCILRSPLMIGAEMTKNDDFTLSLLTNADALYANQHGHSAHPVKDEHGHIVWMSQGEDGRIFVGLFNTNEEEQPVKLPRCLITQKPIRAIRSIWQQQDVPADTKYFTVPAHGAVMLALEI